MAQRTLEELIVKILGDSSGARVEVEKAVRTVQGAHKSIEREVSGINRQMERLNGTIGLVGKGLAVFGVALGVKGLASFVTRTVEAAGALDGLSKQLGVGVEKLQAYQYAATQSSVSQEQLSTGLQTLTRNIGNAVNGNKAAADTFNRLGISLRDAEGNVRSTDDVLADLADRLQQIPDAATRAAEAQRLMGDAGAKMAPLLAKGSEGLRQFEERARSLGLVLSEEQVAAADAAGNAMAEFGLVLDRIQQKVGAQLAPAVSRLFEALNRPEIIEAITAAFEALAWVLEQVIDGVTWLISKVADLIGVIADLFSTADPAKAADFQALFEAIQAGQVAAGQAAPTVTRLGSALGGAASKASDADKAWQNLLQTFEDEISILDKQLQMSGAAEREREIEIRTLRNLQQLRQSGLKISEMEADEAARYIEYLKLLNAQQVDRELGLKAIQDAQKKAVDAQKAALKAAEDAVKRYGEEVKRVSQSIADDVTTAIYEAGENGFDSILENVGDWVRRIGLEVLKQRIILPITMQIVDAVPEAFGLTRPSGAGVGVGGNGIDLFGAVGSLATDTWDWIGRSLGFAGSAAPAAGGGSLMGSVLQGGLSTAASAGTPGYWAQMGGFGGVLGGAGTGLAIGGLLGSLTGGNTVGSSIGGTVGGIAGSFLTPVLGPVAPILGGALGGILGGLFGNKRPSDRGQWATANLATGDIGRTGLEGDKFSSANRQIADTLADRLMAFVQSVEELTGAQFAGQFGFIIGDRDGQRARIGNKIVKVAEQKNEAGLEKLFDYVAKAAVGAASGLDGELETILKRSLDLRKSLDDTVLDLMLAMELLDGTLGQQEEAAVAAQVALDELNKTFDDAAQRARELKLSEEQVEEARQRAIQNLKTGFIEGLQDQILAITNPAAFALKQLDKEFDELRKNAEVFGVGLVEVERLYALRRAEVIEQIGQASVSSLQKFLEELTFGNLSAAGADDRLAGTRAAFEAAAAQAMAGDYAARGRIQELGQGFLTASRGYNASGAEYYADLARVREVVEALLADIPGYAGGTPFAPGGLAWVGEEGPELMVLPRGTGILPNGISEAMAGRSANDGGMRSLLRASLEQLQEARAMRGALDRIAAEQRSQGSAIRRLQARQTADAA